MEQFVKIRWTSAHGSTAGLVLTFDRCDKMTVTEFSRLFPNSEAMKMGKIEKSPVFSLWDDAFAWDFDSDGCAAQQVVNPQLLKKKEVKID